MNREMGGHGLEVPVNCEEDVIVARQKVREFARELGLSPLDQTRLVTAVSELSRNIVVHAGKGRVIVSRCGEAGRDGLKVVFVDQGPGISDLQQAMEEGFSTVGSLGLGLKGAKRLVDEFDIRSSPGRGTTVEIIKWK